MNIVWYYNENNIKKILCSLNDDAVNEALTDGWDEVIKLREEQHLNKVDNVYPALWISIGHNDYLIEPEKRTFD